MSSNKLAENPIDTSNIIHRIRPALMASIIASSAALVGCGGNETLTENNQEPVQAEQPLSEFETTDLVLALTDAEEDFLSYTVAVNSILLTKENGDQTEILPERTTVDFVEYQELTELFSVVKAPVGKYQSIQIELDYSEAYILIQDENGQSFEAQVLDSDENLVTTMIVDFQLERDESLELEKGKRHFLTLDLDLSASNTIVSFEPAVVEVQPFITGEVSLDEEREHRVRGTIAAVDTDHQTVTLLVKPMRKKGGEFGEFDVTLNDETQIEIDGVETSLTDALNHLSNQGDSYPLVAFGTAVTDAETGEVTYTASQVLAGTSVPWSGKDVFKGIISQLEDGVSYVNGIVIDTDGLGRTHVANIPLSYNETTSFVSRFELELDASYLVPGQNIKSLGSYNLSDEQGLSHYSVNDETVRIMTSEAMGQISAIDANGLLTLDVSRFNKRPGKVIKRKNKKQGNKDMAMDNVSLETLVIDTSGLSQLQLEAGDWIKVKGLLNPESHVSDMHVSSVVEYQVSDSQMKYSAFYGQSGSTPVIAQDNSSLTLDLSQGRHKMNFRFNPVNMLPEIDSLVIVAADEAGKFALVQRGEQTVFYSSFVEINAALAAKLVEGEMVQAISATATFDAENSQLQVSNMLVKLN